MKTTQRQCSVSRGVSQKAKFHQLAGLVIIGLLLGAGSGIPLCAGAQAGTVFAWGNNSYGQTDVPAGLTNVTGIAAGDLQSLALKADGTVVAWGRAVNGLTTVPAGLTNVIAVAMGFSNAMALKADGAVVVWGTNSLGPVPMPPGLTNMVAIGTGYAESLVLRGDRILFGWWGRLPGSYLTPVQTNVVAGAGIVAGGFLHSVALRPGGTVVAWGDNSKGQCNVPADLTNAVAVAAGYGYSLAVKDDGTLAGWGNVTVPADVTNAVAISAGGGHILALKADGTVISWKTGSSYIPNTVPAGLTNVLAIAAGGNHDLALVGDGPPLLKAAASDLKLSGAQLSVSLPTQSGRVYQLEYSSSLTASNWAALPLAPGTGGAQTLTDPSASGTQRFYRVRRW